MVLAKERNSQGLFLRISAQGRGRPLSIFIPEVAKETGWDMVEGKIKRFVMSGRDTRVKTYKEAADIPPWPNLELNIAAGFRNSRVDFEVEKSCERNVEYLSRCPVGRVGALDSPIPPKAELQSWVDRHWKVAGGVKVIDISGKYFLFVFPSKEEAQLILERKCWFVNQSPLFLDIDGIQWGAAIEKVVNPR